MHAHEVAEALARNLTLNETLTVLGLEAEDADHGQKAIRRNGVLLKTGTAGEVWGWLRSITIHPSLGRKLHAVGESVFAEVGGEPRHVASAHGEVDERIILANAIAEIPELLAIAGWVGSAEGLESTPMGARARAILGRIAE